MNQENPSTGLNGYKILQMLLRGFKRLWIFALLLTLALGGLMGLRAWRSYVPSYTASVTFTVYTTGTLQSTSQSYNTATAEQMAKTFPYILTSGALSEIIREDLNIASLPSISASAVDDTNFLDLTVTGRDPQLCYDVLQSVIKNYPKVAELVVGPTVMELVDDSGVPTEPTNARQWIHQARHGVLLGLVISVAAMLAYGYVKSTVMGREDMEAASNAKYLGSLPKVVRKRRTTESNAPILIRGDENRAYRDSFRLIILRVEKHMRSHGSQVLLVTSAIPGEGKTTVAFNLACGLVRQGKRVLVLDCDLRNPSVYDMTGQEVCDGIGEYLRGKIKEKDALEKLVHTPEGEHMPDVIYAGKAGRTSPELLGSEKFRTMMEKLRQRYDIIIVDTPPCSMLSDVSELSGVVDCAMLVVRQNFASRASVISSITTLSEYDIPVAGYVINAFAGVLGTGSGYGTGYGYSYGYGAYGYGYRYGSYGYGSSKKSEKSSDTQTK